MASVSEQVAGDHSVGASVSKQVAGDHSVRASVRGDHTS
jgi:hypothetical protein